MPDSFLPPYITTVTILYAALPHCFALRQHASIVTYRTKGVAGFEKCLFQLAPIQLYTVLRNPVEKWWSGVYFWKKVALPDTSTKASCYLL